MMIYKVLIVEDEPPSSDLLVKFIGRISWLKVVGTEADPFIASEILQNSERKIDIVLLDIDLPGKLGTEIAKVIPAHICIIFSSAYGNYALEAFSLNAVDFLQKPFSFERFLDAMQRAKIWLSRGIDAYKSSTAQKYNVKLSGKGQNAFIVDEEIIYLETLKDNLYFHLEKNTSYKTNYTIEYIMQSLNTSLFLQVHRSFIINIKKVRGLSNGNIIMSNGAEIPLGNMYRNSFHERFIKDENIKDL